MCRPRSVVFDVGLAAGGCLLALPAVRWLWPFGDTSAWGGWPLLAGTFVASYLLVRAVDRLVHDLETEVRGRLPRGGSPDAEPCVAADPALKAGRGS